MNSLQSKFSFLLVDDDPNIISLLKSAFKDSSYKIYTALDGQSALDLMEKVRIDATLIDLVMPGMDGITLLKEIKKDYPETMAVMLSGYPEKIFMTCIYSFSHSGLHFWGVIQMSAKNRDEILNLLTQYKPELQTRFKVRHLALFGSYARGDQQPDSDVDILVDVDPSIGLEFVFLAEQIEQLLGVRVELVSQRAIKPRHMKFIEQELIYV